MLHRIPILPVRLILAAGFGLLLSSGPLFPQTAARNDAFPIEVGNSWTYAGTVWWTPRNSFRILKEQVNWEIEVVDLIERPGVRAAVLRGLPNDLVVLGRGREPAEYLLVQIGEDRLYLVSGARIGEVLRGLREPRGRSPADLVRESELVLDLPLFAGKTFCAAREPSGTERACWSVRDQSSIDLAAVGGLSGARLRERYTIDLHWGGDHIVWGFVPGVGLTSYAIGHNGVVSAAELDLVEASLQEPGAAPSRQMVALTEEQIPKPATLDRSTPERSRPGGTAAGGSVAMRDEPRGTASLPDTAIVPKPQPEPPRDGDGDGIVDPLDVCPDTAAGAAVNSAGCPLPQDGDGDGVVDPADACPESPSGAPVNAAGCPVPRDSDGDTVVDPADACPHTPPGHPINASGCPLPRDADGDGVIDPLDACPDTDVAEVDRFGCPPPPPPTIASEPVAEEPAIEQAVVEESEAEDPGEVPAEVPDEVPSDPPEEPAVAMDEPAPIALDPDPEPSATPDSTACLDDREGSTTPVEFEGRLFAPDGGPEPISDENLIGVGENDGVPLFVGVLTSLPYRELWLPLCRPSGSYQLYLEVGPGD